MRKYNYITFGILAVVALAVWSACDETTMDKKNEYDRYPREAQTQFFLPDAIVKTGDRTVGGDFNIYASIYIEHEGGVDNQLYSAEIRTNEPTSSTTYNNTWNSTYTALANAKKLIARTSEGGDEAGSKVTEGISRILLVYNGIVLTDMFGDTPYTEAGVVDANEIPVYRMPKIDKQADIYTDALKQLDTAIALLETGEKGVFGLAAANDYIYGADAKKWIRAAYAMKARYTMHLLYRSTDKEGDLKKVLDYIDKAFSSAADQFSLTFYNGSTQMNPWAAFNYSRSALGVSKSFLTKLTDRNDPRAKQMFMTNSKGQAPIEDTSQLVVVPNGDANSIKESKDIYSRLITDVASSAPIHLLSYHELLFIKAEAYARLGDNRAEATLIEAMVAGFANLSRNIEGAFATNDISGMPIGFNLSAETCRAYYDANVKKLFDANKLKEIMTQKYLAMNGPNGESMECYNDVRRLMAAGENFITLANPRNAENEFPHRFVYGSSDVTTNPEIEKLVGNGKYVYSEKVWWAGGTK